MWKLLIMWVTGGLWWLSDLILKPRSLSCDKVYELELRKGRFDKDAYQATCKRKFTLASDYGYELSCELLEPAGEETEYKNSNASKRKIAVLCHGFTYAKYGCLIYAEIFLKQGFTVLIYDHRNHGLSGKAYTTMGYYEKYDLKKVIDWCYDTYGSDCRIVTLGESMGAATVLLHLGIDDRVKCVIADCAYSDLDQLIKYQLHKYYHLPRLLIPVVSFITYLRAGFWYKEVSPIQVVKQTDKPILFVHGKNDSFVPTYMTKQMYESKKDKKAMLLVAGAKHTGSCLMNRNGYEKKLVDFLNTYFN